MSDQTETAQPGRCTDAYLTEGNSASDIKDPRLQLVQEVFCHRQAATPRPFEPAA